MTASLQHIMRHRQDIIGLRPAHSSNTFEAAEGLTKSLGFSHLASATLESRTPKEFILGPSVFRVAYGRFWDDAFATQEGMRGREIHTYSGREFGKINEKMDHERRNLHPALTAPM